MYLTRWLRDRFSVYRKLSRAPARKLYLIELLPFYTYKRAGAHKRVIRRNISDDEMKLTRHVCIRLLK